MTHDEIRARLLGALDGTLDPGELDEVERHVQECAACRTEQVELHQMRRSLDREERVREAAAPPARFGALGLNGFLRVGILAAGLAVVAVSWARRASAPPAPPPSSPVVRHDFGAAPGEFLLPAGQRALLGMPGNARAALLGPCRVDWTGVQADLREGCALFDGEWTLALEGLGCLRGAPGRAAAWRTPAGALEIQVLSGGLLWEGAAAPGAPRLEAGVGLRAAPGYPEPALLPGEVPGWADALSVLFVEADAVHAVPNVRVSGEP